MKPDECYAKLSLLGAGTKRQMDDGSWSSFNRQKQKRHSIVIILN